MKGIHSHSRPMLAALMALVTSTSAVTLVPAAGAARPAVEQTAQTGVNWRGQTGFPAAGTSIAPGGGAAPMGGTAAARLFGHQAGATGQASAVVNPGLGADLSASERADLARNGFVVIAPPPLRGQTALPPQNAVYWQFYDLYEQNVSTGIPAFVTSDALLHAFHVIYDRTLVALERSVLAGKLQRLDNGLAAVIAAQYAAASDARVKAAARLDLAYVAVAERLLTPRAVTPAVVAVEVNRELGLIAAHRGLATSPVVGDHIDYSRFVPRGHYAGDATLSRYFQAMTWYGLLSFHLNGPDGALRTRQALLLVRALAQRPDLKALWSSVFDPITAWVGRSDDLTVRDYAPLLVRVYGIQAPLNVLADDARLARFIALANALPNPQIRDEILASSNAAVNATKGLRLFGQRFTPDAAILQALIWGHVGTAQKPRLWPQGLDVAAALGSTQAGSLLSGPYRQTRYAHYARQLATVRRAYAALPPADWSQNLYWRWLNTLRAAWGPVPPAAPAFMKTTAWAAKSLATGLASWAELHHDTLLYVKQVSGLGGGAPPPIPVAYVEPIPLLYARLLALTQALKATLSEEGVLDSLPQPIDKYTPWPLLTPIEKGVTGYHAALDDFAGLVALAQRVSEQELLGQKVATADLLALETIGAPLSELDRFFQDNAARKFLDFFPLQTASIADVFTEPRSQQVLEVGVGDVLPIYVTVTVNGRRWLARGGVYSYYEFHQPLSDRLSDDAWRLMSRRPALPAWTAGYIAR